MTMRPVASEPAASGRSDGDWPGAVASAFLLATTALLLHLAIGYRPFPSLDDFAYLPVFRHAADPTLYPNDLVLQQMSLHSPGWYWLYRLCDATVGLARGFWLVTLALAVATVAATARIARTLSMSPAMLPITGLLVFASKLNGVGRGAYDGAFGAAMHGQWLALVCLLFAYDAFVRRAPVRSGVFLGLSALSHVSVAIHGGFVLAVGCAVAERHRVRTLSTIAAVSLAVGAPAVVPMLSHLSHSAASTWTTERIIDDGYLFRLPHEYALDLGTAGDLGSLLLVLAAAAGALFLRRAGRGSEVARLASLAAGQALLLGVAALFYAGLPHASVLPYLLALTRTSPLLVVILGVVATAGLDRFLAWPQSNVPFHLLAGAALAIAVFFELRMFVSWGSATTALVLLAIALGLSQRGRFPRAILASGLAASALVTLALVAKSDAVDASVDGDERALYGWAHTSTPVDALFVVPPGFEAFRWYASRSAYVDFKLFPPASIDSISTWRERLDDVAAPDRRALAENGWRAAREMDRCYATRNTPGRIADLLERTGATYFVWDTDGLRIPPLIAIPRPADARLVEAYRNARFTVYSLAGGGHA